MFDERKKRRLKEWRGEEEEEGEEEVELKDGVRSGGRNRGREDDGMNLEQCQGEN